MTFPTIPELPYSSCFPIIPLINLSVSGRLATHWQDDWSARRSLPYTNDSPQWRREWRRRGHGDEGSRNQVFWNVEWHLRIQMNSEKEGQKHKFSGLFADLTFLLLFEKFWGFPGGLLGTTNFRDYPLHASIKHQNLGEFKGIYFTHLQFYNLLWWYHDIIIYIYIYLDR